MITSKSYGLALSLIMAIETSRVTFRFARPVAIVTMGEADRMGLDRRPDEALFVETRVLIGQLASGAVLRQQPQVDELSGGGLDRLRFERWVLQERSERIRFCCHSAIERSQALEAG